MDLITQSILVTQQRTHSIAPEAAVEVDQEAGDAGNFGAANGGSGIVVLRYQIRISLTAKATGGTISFYNGKTTHTFTSSGDFSIPPPTGSALTCEYVVVGGRRRCC